jgi:uroporphyrin-III C-methyltransferase
LLTLKAVARLAAADTILFDDLVSEAILAHARSDADLVSVGKRAGRASPKQDHVNRLLIDFARQGKRVVRLKSGDAGLFGRLEEELDAVRAAGLDFEIIPGVTAPSAAAAAAGIPLTRRASSRRVQFITGADTSGNLPEDINWAALTDPTATTAVFMGRRTFSEIARNLIANGLEPRTPVLLAEAVGHAAQSLVRTDLGRLANELKEAAAGAPTMIIFGPLLLPPSTDGTIDD